MRRVRALYFKYQNAICCIKARLDSGSGRSGVPGHEHNPDNPGYTGPLYRLGFKPPVGRGRALTRKPTLFSRSDS